MLTCDLLMMWLSHIGTHRSRLGYWHRLDECWSPGSYPRDTQFSGCLHVRHCPSTLPASVPFWGLLGVTPHSGAHVGREPRGIPSDV